MKIRNGFVSNSSSSSFVFFLPKLPESVEEVKKLLFPHGEGEWDSPWGHAPYTADEVAEQVFNDMQRGVLTEKEIFEKASGWGKYNDPECPDYPPYHHRPDTDCKSDKVIVDVIDTMNWHLYNTALERYGKKKAEQLMKDYPGHVFIEVEYGNEMGGGLASDLEEGSLFDGIPHIKSSHH